MKDVTDDKSLQQVLLCDSDVVINSGYSKPLVLAKCTDRAEISGAITLHYTLLQSLAEMEQLKKGLEALGFLEIIKNNPNLLAPFFTAIENRKLTAGMISSV